MVASALEFDMRPALDETFRTMASSERRRVLTALADRDSSSDGLSVPGEVPIGDRDREMLDRTLYHTHLPVLDDGGFVRWDRDARRVWRGPRFEAVRPLLSLLGDCPDELTLHE